MNELIQKTEEAIRAKSNPRKLDDVVEAGEGIMFSEGGAGMFKEQVDKPGDIVENAAEGVAKLLGILFEQSKGTMPMDTAITAASILLLRGLDFLEEAGRVQVTNEVIAQAMKAMSSYVLQLFGVTQDQIKGMAAQNGEKPASGPEADAKPRGLLSGAMQGGA